MVLERQSVLCLGIVPNCTGSRVAGFSVRLFCFSLQNQRRLFFYYDAGADLRGYVVIFRNETGFGGNNGFTGFTTMLGFPVSATSTRIALFLATLALLIASLALGLALARTKFGRVLTAVRDAENRLMFCGYDPKGFKLFVWTLSAVLCALAGALYVPQVGIINPSEMSPTNSIEAAIWVALGAEELL